MAREEAVTSPPGKEGGGPAGRKEGDKEISFWGLGGGKTDGRGKRSGISLGDGGRGGLKQEKDFKKGRQTR